VESAGPSRVFVDWTVYKTRGAMTVKFIKPTWTPANGQGGGFVVDRCARGLRRARLVPG
jgi:hypothetical protein